MMFTSVSAGRERVGKRAGTDAVDLDPAIRARRVRQRGNSGRAQSAKAHSACFRDVTAEGVSKVDCGRTELIPSSARTRPSHRADPCTQLGSRQLVPEQSSSCTIRCWS